MIADKGDRKVTKGRGAPGNAPGRYARTVHEAQDDGWFDEGEPAGPPRTQVTEEQARSVLSRNTSPDLPFDRSVNAYRGCEHGCSYCFARPSHSYLELSPGLDFETRLFAKTNAAERLRAELARPGYRCAPIAMGTNTDPYQPIERRYRITRQLIELLAECRHPFTLLTKNALIERDLDLLAPLAREGLVSAALSVTTLDNRLAARMEPRASAPHRRLQAIRRLAEAGVPTGVMFAPVIPAVNDHELEHVLEAAREAGATRAGYVLLRLPHELKQHFRDWLDVHHPERAEHVMSLVRQSRGGRDYDASFGQRQRGTGAWAELVRARFDLAWRRLGYAEWRSRPLDIGAFVPPRAPTPQGQLF
ncbi:PA0069 family radical SAM protein [Arenimonas sp. MALMAid1274]|uniref:PA0069 family radical SAM protein n=1 Tax=Arenimonas sp. MALMAid1274 TaxID=3411630 RepID=UPI003B9E31AE